MKQAEKVHVLVVEDDLVLGGALRQRLKLEGFSVELVDSCATALRAMYRRQPDFVLSDIVLPDGSGEDLYLKCQQYLGQTPIVFATAFGEIEQAVRLVKAGADDYLSKPFDVEELVERIRASVRTGARSAAQIDTDELLSSTGSVKMRVLKEQLQAAAQTDLPVLLIGETGTGKELSARALHAQSMRAKAPFVAVNCGAIPRELLESQFFGHERGAFTGATNVHVGYFEEAGEGTLFLDEIGELDAKLQVSLLRVLQDGRYRPVGARQEKVFGGRMLAATNADLAELRNQKLFRDDLYYRLAVIEIFLPPLRERKEDVEALAEQFLTEARQGRGASSPRLSEKARSALLVHPWPGNVRELRNRLYRAAALAKGPAIEPEDLFPEQRLAPLPASQTLEGVRKAAEAEQIERALLATQGRVGEAAKLLGVSRTTLWKRKK